MQFKCSPNALREAIQMLIAVCPVKTTLPILANVKITAEVGKIELTGTSLDLAIRTELPADVVEEGITTIPVRLLHETLKQINCEIITITVDEKYNAKIVAGNKIECTLRGLSPEEFPQFPTLEEKGNLEIETKEFSAMLKHTSFAASKSENRYVLNGVCFNFGEQFEAVATDAHRLAKYTMPNVKQAQAQQLVVPSKSISMIQQILNVEGTVFIRYSVSQIEINVNKTTLVTRLIDGQFPNYQQVIPKTFNHAIEVDRRAFMTAINLANVVNDKNKQPTVIIKIHDNKLNVSANSSEIGQVFDELDVVYSGEVMEIGFNPTFLIEVCQNVSSDTIVLEVVKENSPTTIKAGENFLCVIMPMRKP